MNNKKRKAANAARLVPYVAHEYGKGMRLADSCRGSEPFPCWHDSLSWATKTTMTYQRYRAMTFTEFGDWCRNHLRGEYEAFCYALQWPEGHTYSFDWLQQGSEGDRRHYFRFFKPENWPTVLGGFDRPTNAHGDPLGWRERTWITERLNAQLKKSREAIAALQPEYAAWIEMQDFTRFMAGNARLSRSAFEHGSNRMLPQ